MGEMALKYYGGPTRKAETLFGWGRDAVRCGLGETKTGIRCLGNFSARERKKFEERCSAMAEAIERIVES